MNDKSTSHCGEPVSAAPAGPTTRPKRILVVDDDPSALELMTTVLSFAGYGVEVAEDGELAWEALRVGRYDLLVTDNAMPNTTGIELVRKLRAKNSTLPVVMATGRIPEEVLEENSRLGISDILIKPFNIEQILNAVKKALCEAVVEDS